VHGQLIPFRITTSTSEARRGKAAAK